MVNLLQHEKFRYQEEQRSDEEPAWGSSLLPKSAREYGKQRIPNEHQSFCQD